MIASLLSGIGGFIGGTSLSRGNASGRARRVGHAALQRAATAAAALDPLEPRVLLSSSPAVELFGTSPAVFVQNRGQWTDQAVRFGYQGNGASIDMTDTGAYFRLTQTDPNAAPSDPSDPLCDPAPQGIRTTSFAVHFDGARSVCPVGQDPSRSVFNYYVGDQSQWRSNVPGFETITYTNLYEGIDLATSGMQGSLKYEFRVAPGSDYHAIKLSYEGTNGLTIDAAGRLHILTDLGDVIDDAPFAYQVIDGRKVEVAAQYQLVDGDTYQFQIIGDYGPNIALVIDPKVDWSTSFGPWDNNARGSAIATDASGNAWITGDWGVSWTSNGMGAIIIDYDAFVTKLNADGSEAWTTFMGGTSSEYGNAIAIDASGNVWVTGTTGSPDFASGGFDTSFNGGYKDAFVAKINADGSLAWSSYLGGTGEDSGEGIATDSSGNAWVTGTTDSPDLASGGFDTSYGGGIFDGDAFLAKINADGSLAWSSYLGGTGEDSGDGIATDSSGNAWVTGTTHSPDFASGGFDTSYSGSGDAFVAKINANGSLAWSSYLGEWAGGYGIATDASGNAWVTGWTMSSGWASGGFDTSLNGYQDAYVAKINADGSLAWSSYLGGAAGDYGYSIAIDPSGNAWVTGDTGSYALVAKISADGALGWSSYLSGLYAASGHGIAADPSGNAWVTGTTHTNHGQYTYGLLAKIDREPPSVMISQAATQDDPTTSTTINFTVVFSEPVTDFTSDDVTLSGTAGATTKVVTGDGSTYNVAVSGMTQGGTVIASIAAGVVHDAAGYPNTASSGSDNSVIYSAPPAVTINQAAAQEDPTGLVTLNFAVVLSEPVTDFTSDDVTLSGTAGATTAVVSGSGSSYNVAVSGMAQSGTVIATIAAGVAHDAAGNPNYASTSSDNSVTYNALPPSVTINQAATQADPTNSATINFTVAFSEPVTDFTSDDVTLDGTAEATTAVVTGSGTTYNVAVSGMNQNGTVIATIAAGVAHGVANNPNAASTSSDNSVTYNSTPPSVTINQAVGQYDPAILATVNFTVVFSEPVTDFRSDDVTLSGTAGATMAVVTGDGTTYNVAVSGMTQSGTVIASIAAGVAYGAAGNANTASTSSDNSVTYDVTMLAKQIWSSYLGGTDYDYGTGIAIDPSGNVWITGVTYTAGWASGGFDTSFNGSTTYSDAFVAKINANGTLAWTSYLGGTGSDEGRGIAIDPSGNAWITGYTKSSGWASGRLGATFNNSSTYSNAFVAKINADGTLAWSSFLGGSGDDEGNGIAIDPSGNAWVTGCTDTVSWASGGFDTTPNGGSWDAFVAKINANGTLAWSSFLGGSGDDYGNGIAIDPSGNAWVTGETGWGPSWVSGGFDTSNSGTDAFVAKINANGTLAWSSYLGGTYGDAGNGIAIDPSGNAWVTGATYWGPSWVSGGFDTSFNGDTGNDAFVAKINADGTLAWSSCLGGTSGDYGYGIAVDPSGNAWVTGHTFSSGWTSDGFDTSYGGGYGDAFVARINANGTLAWTSYLGGAGEDSGRGIASDSSGNVWFAGKTQSPDIASAGFDTIYNGGDAFVARINREPPSVTINQAATQADPTALTTINFTVVFSEAVTDFTSDDVTLSGTAGPATAVVSGSGTTYNVAVSGMIHSGTVIATIAAGIAHDVLSKANTASTSSDNSVTYDGMPPTVLIDQTANQADPTNSSTINFTVVFSEPVTGFTSDDVTLSGTAGATTKVVTGSGTTYNVAVSGMSQSGTVIATIADGVAHDAAGNDNYASTSSDNSVTYDVPPPTVTINQADTQLDPTGSSTINFTVVFSEPVTDFTSDDVTLEGTAGATTAVVSGSGTTYNVAVSGMTQAGTVIASIAAGVAHNAAGNANVASTSTDNSVANLHVNHLACGVSPMDTLAGAKASSAMVVWVEDAFGQIVVSDNKPVTFKLTGPANKTITVKAKHGVATMPNLTLTKAGHYFLTALHNGYQDVPPEEFDVIPGAATRMVFTLQPASTVAGNTFAAQVTLKDKYGNVATNNSSFVTLNSTPAGLTVTASVQNGVAVFDNLLLTKTGSYRLVATDGALRRVTSRNFTISPDSTTSQLVLLQPLPPTATALAGKTIKPAIKVAVRDQFGNVIKSNHTLVTLAITSGPSNAILKGSTARKLNNGTATFNNLSLTLAGSYSFVLSDLNLAVLTAIPMTVEVL